MTGIYTKSPKTPFELLEKFFSLRKYIHYYILSLLLIIVAEFVLILFLAKKPPLVIRIDRLGNTAVSANYVYDSKVTTTEDVQNFTKVFLNNYVGLRSDLIVAQLEKSLNMMSKSFAVKHLEEMQSGNFVSKIQAANVRNEVEMTKFDYEMAGDTAYVSIGGFLKTRPLDQMSAPPQVKPLIAELVLEKVKRTPDHPYGLVLNTINIHEDESGEKIQENFKEVVNAE